MPLIAPRPYNIQHSTEIHPPGTQGRPTPGSHAGSVSGGPPLSVQPAVSGGDMFLSVSGALGFENSVPHQSYAYMPQSASRSCGTGLHPNIFDRQSTISSSDNLQRDNQNRDFDPGLLNRYPQDVRFSSDRSIPHDLVIDSEYPISLCQGHHNQSTTLFKAFVGSVSILLPRL